MNEPNIISIRGVSKYFGAVHAVDNVDLEIQRGEFFVLLGPSGCGKTTLLRILAGLEMPSEGEIFIDGQPMSAIPAYRRPVNMVFQNYAIFPHLDVRGNIAFGLRKSGLSKAEINAKVEEMLDLIKLPGYEERSATQLSGGERQRIALALATMLGAGGMFLSMKYEFKEAVTAGDTMPLLVAVLDTNFWLATHVTTSTLGYAAGLLAAAIAHVWLLGKLLGYRRGDQAFYQAVSQMTYGVVCFGLLFTVVGTMLGGVWANYSWGRFWGWDPKENAALMICLWQTAMLQARLGGYIRDRGLALDQAMAGG